MQLYPETKSGSTRVQFTAIHKVLVLPVEGQDDEDQDNQEDR